MTAARKSGAVARGRPVRPHARFERALIRDGAGPVAGVDEVGRGAWAGPASVGVVVYCPDRRAPNGVRDSKELSEDRREALLPLVTSWCLDWSVGHASPGECDLLGMTAALRLAARRAFDGLTVAPRVLLLDGSFDYLTDPVAVTEVPAGRPEVRTVVRGDATCQSIAAASIVAKVTRDRMMRALAPSFPAFDFDRNKGYPSRTHRTALAGFGLTSVHRRSWSFVDDLAFR